MKSEQKTTIVGKVPPNWTLKKLEEISAFITKGGTPTTYGFPWASKADGIPFFRSECVTANGFIEKGMNYIVLDAHKQMKRSEVTSGDLLMTITGNIGRVAKVPNKFASANINQHIARIKIQLGVSADYIFHTLKHDGYAKHYSSIFTGQAYPQLSLQQVRETIIALPSIEEQIKIAAILTAVDDKLDVITRQIAATQTLKQGLMQTLFSRGVGTEDANGRWVPHTEFKDSELGEIPVTWQSLSLEKFCNGALKTGPFGSQLHAAEYQDEGVSVIMPKDLINCRVNKERAAKITPERAESLAKHKLVKGDILFSRRGDVARFALIDEASEGSLCGTGCLKAKPSKEHSSAYLSHLLQLDSIKEWLEQNAVGQTMPNMNTSILASLPLVAPTSLAEEEEIAGILDSLDAKLYILSTKQTHYQTLKRGLMQKLLTGEWRVKLDANTGEQA